MAAFHFSTDDFPAEEKIAAWREIFGQQIAKLDMEPPLNQAFRGKVCAKSLPNLRIGSISSTSNRIARTPRLIADGSDDIMLGIMLKGEAVVSQEGKGEVAVGAGAAVVWSNATVGSSRYAVPVEFLSVAVPRQVLMSGRGHSGDAGLSVIPATSGTLRLLTGYVQLLMREAIPEDMQALSAAYVHDLVALMLHDSGSDAGVRRSPETVRLRAVEMDIDQNLGHHDFTIHTLGHRLGLSPRLIRNLFAGKGTTFTEYVLDRRLARVHDRLSDRGYRGTISALAFDCGFGDLSYFNHAFRRRYGVTPSEVRAAAMDAADGPNPNSPAL